MSEFVEGEAGHDCPDCGGVLTELYGGDGDVSVPPVGVCCVSCDFLHYDDAPWPSTPTTGGAT